MRDGFEADVRRLVSRLARNGGRRLFNPYHDRDPRFDLRDAAARRRRNLRIYLQAFGRARWALVGEAAGYNGCRFSGIPFTGEDLLVGEHPLPWAAGTDVARSSQGRPLSSEKSANIIWGAIRERGDIVLWNAVPWHPHRPHDPLSNRKPTRAEEDRGLEVLPEFLELFPDAEVAAVGRVAERSLERIGIDAPYLRHPSMGGQNEFLRGLRKLCG